jgi:hypothetical protein
MIESVNKYCSSRAIWNVLVFSDEMGRVLQSRFPNDLNIIRFADLSKYDLQNIKDSRPHREFCWTLAAILLDYAAETIPERDFGAYVDSDCFFFNDIATVLKQISGNDGILIHGHNFSPEFSGLENTSGRFNVGLVAGINGPDFKACMNRWKNQVTEFSGIDTSRGIYGDQTYLNDWDSNFSSLAVAKGLGIGLAPWNVTGLDVYRGNPYLEVNSDLVYFYHFHALKILEIHKNFLLVIPSLHYRFHRSVINLIYKPYIKEIIDIKSEIGLEFTLAGGFLNAIKFLKWRAIRHQIFCFVGRRQSGQT